MKHFRWIAPLLGLLFFSCTSAEQMMRESVTLYGDTARIVCVGNTEVTGELLCYRYVDMWIVDSANRIRVISYADIKRLEVGGVVIRAYFWPTVAAIALP